jgi:hypothetical protein
MHDQLLLLAAILARWQRPVDSSEALDLLYWAMHGVSYRCTTMAIKNGQQSGCIFSLLMCSCCPGGCRAIRSEYLAYASVQRLPG